MVTHALLLIVAANAGPILAQRIFGDRWATPVDLGACLPDGKPVFGPAKTWRGLLAAVLASAAIASPLGISPTTGALVGVVAMFGDLASSCVKRRLGLPASSRASFLDQVPESLLPALALAPLLQLSFLEVTLTVALFFLLEFTLSRPLYRLKIRRHPY